MSKYLIEEAKWPPAAYHYVVQRNGLDKDSDRAGAEDQLKRNGCTRIVHVVPENESLGSADSSLHSYGIVEPGEVVRQRIRMPRHD